MRMASFERDVPVQMPIRFRYFWALVAIAAFTYCAWRVIDFVRQYRLNDIIDWFSGVPASHVVASALLAAGSYATLTGFDYLAVRYSGHRLPYPKVALASFVSLAVGYSLGPAPLGTGAVRYFYYSRLGLGLEAFAKLMLLIMMTAIIGKLSFAGLTLIYDSSLAAKFFGMNDGWIKVTAVAALGSITLYVILCASWRGNIRVGSWVFALPLPSIALGQVFLGTADYLFIAGSLHQLMSASASISFSTVATAYVFANFAVMLTHVPGGWGVLEFVVLSFIPQLDTVGALIAFRTIYYLTPLALGLILLFLGEGWRSVKAIRRSG
jgi:uncharacterized membrane protein YbhN (UPF0104 family)